MANNKDLIDAFADEMCLSKKESKEYFEKYVSLSKGFLKEGELYISGFGRFVVKGIPKRKGFNPYTKEMEEFQEGKKIMFTPSKELKDLIKS